MGFKFEKSQLSNRNPANRLNTVSDKKEAEKFVFSKFWFHPRFLEISYVSGSGFLNKKSKKVLSSRSYSWYQNTMMQ